MDYLAGGDIEKKLKRCLELLFNNDRYLFKNNVNERSISHMLAFYLKSEEFQEWDVDCEFNKDHDHTKTLNNLNNCLNRERGKSFTSDTDGRTVYPDIIVHQRGTKNNLLVIEIKKSTSQVGNECDIAKLNEFRKCQRLRYCFAIFLKLKTGSDEANMEDIQWY